MRHPFQATLLMALTFSLLQPPVLATGQPQSQEMQMAHAKSPGQVVSEFYQAAKRQYWRTQLTRLKPVFSRELYDLLVRADKLDPESGDFLDYDPFSNSQMGIG